MLTSNGAWPQLTPILTWIFPVFIFYERVQEQSQGMGSCLMSKNGLCQSLVVPPWLRSLALIVNLTVVRMAVNQLEVCLLVPLTLRRGALLADGITDVLQLSSSSVEQAVYLLCFQINGEALLLIGLCLRCHP